jgi:uncharacterized protein (TIGR04255 family)
MDFKWPSFADPPVAEVVLGVQFEPLGMTSGHLGWYWRECLGNDWPTATEAPALPDQVESFGGKRAVHWPVMQFQFQSGPTTNRLQVRNRDQDRMVQIQDTRFIYNWVRRNGVYPRYTVIRQEFDQLFARFRQFTVTAKLAELRLNQWEVTYVNHVPCEPLWEVPADGQKVFPALLKRPEPYGGTKFETLMGEWRSEIPPQRGRLHVHVRYQEVKRPDASPVDVLVAHLTARGPIAEDQDWNADLNLGHETIVIAFRDISSDLARKHWGEEV